LKKSRRNLDESKMFEVLFFITENCKEITSCPGEQYCC
jgi:hypothetical protein